MSLSVGDVIYIIDPEKKSIVPARVNEQLVSRTLAGEKTTHKVELTNSKEVILEDTGLEFFTTLADIEAHLLNKAKEMIKASSAAAAEIAASTFGNKQSVDSPSTTTTAPKNASVNGNTSDMHITLENGQKIKVNIPEGF